VRRSGDEHADSVFALSVTSWPTVAVAGTTLSERPGTEPDVVRWGDRIHARAPAIRGERSRASLARNFASSARVRASEDNIVDVRDAPASTLRVLPVANRLATAVAVTPFACTVKDVPADPSSDVLNGTSANSPPLVPPATQSDAAPSPVRTWPGDSDVTALEQSVLATCVAVAVVDGAVVSVQAAAPVTISMHTMVLRRAAAIREHIRLYTFSVSLGVSRVVNDGTTVISYNT